jgi:hypothetical protein
VGNTTRSAKRRKKKTDAIKIDGQQVVFAVTMKEPGLYRHLLFGPETGHTNADMVGMMGCVAGIIVTETAKHSKMPVQECVDLTVKLFRESVEKYAHAVLSGKHDTSGLTTVELDHPPDQPPGPTGLAAKTTEA